jgi:hypothetical protein
VISTGNQNSYKFAAGLAMIELFDGNNKLKYIDIARKLVSYYYKNHVRFGLRETNNPSQPPSTIKIIDYYCKYKYTDKGNNIPKSLTEKDLLELSQLCLSPTKAIKAKPFHQYVFPCWTSAEREGGQYKYPKIGSNEFFEYDSNNHYIVLSDRFCNTIKSCKKIMIDITIFEWTKFLENYNVIPNIIRKISPKKPNQRLSKYKNLLQEIAAEQGNRCYICGKTIQHDDFSIDHVIPFDYLYSDDLWNLVAAHKSCNSSKNSRIGSKIDIVELYARNRLFFIAPLNSHKLVKTNLLDLFKCPKKLEQHIKKVVESCIASGYTQLT